MKKKICKYCLYSAINIWGYTECWRFNTKLDEICTSETADRERTAKILSLDPICLFFVKNNWINRLIDRRK